MIQLVLIFGLFVSSCDIKGLSKTFRMKTEGAPTNFVLDSDELKTFETSVFGSNIRFDKGLLQACGRDRISIVKGANLQQEILGNFGSTTFVQLTQPVIIKSSLAPECFELSAPVDNYPYVYLVTRSFVSNSLVEDTLTQATVSNGIARAKLNRLGWASLVASGTYYPNGSRVVAGHVLSKIDPSTQNISPEAQVVVGGVEQPSAQPMPPPAPNFAFSGGGSISLTWTTIPGTPDTAMELYESTGGAFTKIYSGMGTQYTAAQKSTGQTFAYFVKYIISSGITLDTQAASVTTPIIEQPVVSTTKQKGAIAIAWNAVAGAAYYKITKNSAGLTGTSVGVTTNLSYLDTSITPNDGLYTPFVVACDSNDFCGAPGTSATVSIESMPAPTYISSSVQTTSTSVDVQLSGPIGSILYSRCFIREGGAPSETDTTVTSLTVATFTGLSVGPTYFIACRSETTLWNSAMSAPVSITLRGPYGAIALSTPAQQPINKNTLTTVYAPVSGWALEQSSSIIIVVSYNGVVDSSLSPTGSSAYVMKQIQLNDSSTPYSITFQAKDKIYNTILGSVTTNIYGKPDFLITNKALVTSGGVCKLRIDTNATTLEARSLPILRSISGDTNLVSGGLYSPSDYISGSIGGSLAELAMPAETSYLKDKNDALPVGGLYITYLWKTTSAEVRTLTGFINKNSLLNTKHTASCNVANIASDPNCWNYQYRSSGMSEEIDETAGCSTCSTPNSWSNTIASEASLAAGINHACYVTQANTVKCLGRNDVGQLGNGTITNSSSPVDVVCDQNTSDRIPEDCVGGKLSRVVKVVAHDKTTCALTLGGTPYCWGVHSAVKLFDATLATINNSVWTPTKFRSTLGLFNSPTDAAVDIGFDSLGRVYAIKPNGLGIGEFNGDVGGAVALTDAQIQSIMPAPDSLHISSDLRIARATQGNTSIWMRRASNLALNRVDWSVDIGGQTAIGYATDSRTDPCKRVGFRTKN